MSQEQKNELKESFQIFASSSYQNIYGNKSYDPLDNAGFPKIILLARLERAMFEIFGELRPSIIVPIQSPGDYIGMRTKEDNYTYNWVIDTLGNWAMQCLGKQTTFFKD